MKIYDRPMLTVNINGKEYPCRVTMGAMVRFKRKTGYDVSKLDPSDMDGLMTFIWCCVVSACNADSVEFSMDLEDFADNISPEDISGFFGSPDETPAAKKKTESLTQ